MVALTDDSDLVQNQRNVVDSNTSLPSVDRQLSSNDVLLKIAICSAETHGLGANPCMGWKLLLTSLLPYLTEANIPLFGVNESSLFPGGLVVAKSHTQPQYICFTFQKSVDRYISKSMQENGCIFGGYIHSCFHEIYNLHSQEMCRVMDVGSNIGTFGLFAANHGCEVESFEMQPRAVRLQQTSVSANGWNARYNIHQGAVWSKSGYRISFTEGTFSFSSRNVGGVRIGDVYEGQATQNASEATSFRIDHVISETKDTFLVMKVDVEGSENFVLETTRKYWAKGAIGYIIMEIRSSQHVLLPQLYAVGYKCTLLERRKKISSTCLRNWLPLNLMTSRIKMRKRSHDDLLCVHHTFFKGIIMPNVEK